MHEASLGLEAKISKGSASLYLETMEQVLPGKKKLIVDASKGRRHLVLLDDGVEIGPATAPPIVTQRPAFPQEERD